MVNCSKKRKAQCHGDTCLWIVGKGCKRIRPIPEPIGCSRKRKSSCMDSRHCHWIVGKGCKKNSHQPILPVRRGRIPEAALLGLLAAMLYGGSRFIPPRLPPPAGSSRGGSPASRSPSVHRSPSRSPSVHRSPSRSPSVHRSPSRSPPISPIRPIRRTRSLPILHRRPRSPTGHPIRISPPSFPLTNLKKRHLEYVAPFTWYPFLRKNYYVD